MSVPDPRVIHLDERFVVIDKPSGLLSVPGIGPEKADCAVVRVAREHDGARIVHRLDRDTSGVMVLARDAEAHRNLSIQFQDRLVAKRYVAVVAGLVDADSGTIDLPIRKDMDRPPRQLVDHEQGRPSVTHWSVDRRDPETASTRLVLRPVTGRSHQLRLHLQSIGHAILGDELYAPPDAFAAADRLMLHAEHLEFAHPGTGAPLAFTADAPF